MRASLWLGAAASGLLGWSGRWEWLPVGALVLVLFRLSRTRLEAFGVAGAYHAAPSVGWMPATATFFGSDASAWATAILIWLGAAILLTVPWALLWSKRARTSLKARVLSGTALGLVLMLPPFGLVSWCNPWVAGAAMLPGLGLFGFVFITLCAFAPGARSWPWWASCGLIVIALACMRYEPSSPVDWTGLSTRYGRLSDVDAETHYIRALAALRRAERTGARFVLLPEGLGGRWTKSTAVLWSHDEHDSDRVLLVGALQDRRNGLVIVGKGAPRFWSQRLPPPIGMWAPWSREHVRSELTRSSVIEIEGWRVAMLVCFEQFVSWPALQTALEQPDVVLAPANLWFARTTNLDAVREVTLRSWAALMGWPVVEAING